MSLEQLARLVRGTVQRQPGWTLGALTCGLAALWLLLLPADAPVTSDDGAYAIQAIAVADGGWNVPHVLADVDPGGVTYPYVNSSIGADGYFPGGGHVVWVTAMSRAVAAFGASGLHLLPVLGLGMAVWATSRLANAACRTSAALSSCVLAMCSPLVFDGLQLWAHAFVAALVTIAMAMALETSRRIGPRPVAVLLVAGVLASVLRADGAVFILAIGASLGFHGMLARRPRVVAVGALTAAAAVFGYVLAEHLTSQIAGASTDAPAPARSGLPGRVDSLESLVEGIVHTFVSSTDSPAAFVLAAVAAALFAMGVRTANAASEREATALLLGATGTWALRIVLFPDVATTGLALAFPIVIFAVARPRAGFNESERMIATALAVAGAGIALTQYDQGGGLNWGGRFLAPAIPCLAVLAAAGARTALAWDRSASLRRAFATFLVVLLAASLVFDARARVRHDGVIDRLDGAAIAPVLTSNPALPRIAWRTYPERQWLLAPVDPDGIDAVRLRALLDDAGIDELLVFGVPPQEVLTLLGADVRDFDTELPVLVHLR